jgi:hypothetical protein
MKYVNIKLDELRPIMLVYVGTYIMLRDWVRDDTEYIPNISGDMLNDTALYLNTLRISVDGYSSLNRENMLIYTKNFDISIKSNIFGDNDKPEVQGIEDGDSLLNDS